MLFEIDEDRAIDSALPEGEIINAEHPRGRLGGCRGTAENPEDRVATERHPQMGGHPRPGFATRLTPKYTDRLGQSSSALGMDRSECGEAFGKRLTRTGRRQTTKAADVQAEPYRLLDNREIA